MPNYTIIPGAALQFIDYVLDLGRFVGKSQLAKTLKPFHVAKDYEREKLTILYPLEPKPRPEEEDDYYSGGDEAYVERINKKELPLHFKVKYEDAFRAYQKRWIPFPMFAHLNRNADQSQVYAYGPIDWARAFLTAPEEQGSMIWKLTLVFDPTVERGGRKAEDINKRDVYCALSKYDVDSSAYFSLAYHERDNSWFLERDWVKRGLKEIVEDFKRRNPGAKLSDREEDFPEYALDDDRVSIRSEYQALYETLLEGIYLSEGMGGPVQVVPQTEPPVDTTLVIDVGNSRITGIITETEGEAKLSDSYLLEVRDLTNPSELYAEPLNTSVEFMEPYFGPAEWSFNINSRGHKKSFIWPSSVRVGKEAARLAAASEEKEGPTGMSSPKRYLWDTKGSKLQWYFNNSLNYHKKDKEEQAVEITQYLLRVNHLGVPTSAFVEPSTQDRPDLPKTKLPYDILRHVHKEDRKMAFGAIQSNYSRSSLMMFLLSELIAQALSCINSPSVRDSKGYPNIARRLTNIILTVPTAMPLAEQNILKTWAKLAVEMVWSCLEWWKDFYGVRGPKAEPGKIVDFRHSPESVVCDWYESTCTQMIFLYNEIHKKFHDNATKLFQLLGKPRLMKGPGAPEASRDPSGPQPLQGPQALRGQRGYIRPSPGSNGGSEPIPLAPPPSDLTDSLRVASIDIGGGTTDISIITYVAETPDTSTPLIIPTQDFRDGFNVAGDDIMREIIRTEFIKMLENKAREKGVRNADDIITELFTDTVVKGRQEGGRRDKRKREQFVSQVAVPVALRILELYENTDFTGDDFIRTISLGEILETVPSTVRLTEVLGYVEEAMIKAGWRDIDLYNLSFQTDMRDVDAKVGYVIGQILRDMGEIIKYYDCDVLIMTGRPSRWPAIMRVPYERSFLPPDRIIHMHKYRVDSEYPFVSRSRIEDPKTSVVVGAVICHLASKGLNGIRIQTENLKPKPINRYMGRLYENDGKLDNNPNNLWFENRLIHKGEQHAQKVMIKFNTDTTVGFRQLGVERWTTTRLYRMEFADDDSRARSNGLIPYEIELEHIMTEADDPDDLKTLKKDDISRTEGTIIVRAIKNRLKNEVRNSDINIRLQTLRSRDGYWLDTGELSQY